VKYFYEKCLHIAPWFAEAPGYRTRRSTEFAIKTGQPGEIAKLAAMDKSWKTFLDYEFVIGGSPATVREKLKDACQRLRLGHLMVLLQIGSMSTELTKKNITLFANEVMPYIQDLWDDEGWEDRWWPERAGRRTAQAARPALAGVAG